MVREARQKQLQWFDHQYDPTKINRYLRNFPSELGRGEMTGEASPGYVAYIEVPQRVFLHLGGGARMIAIVRDPADRAYSAYRYHYASLVANPLSFGDIASAEMGLLRGCLERDRQHGRRTDLGGECYARTTAEEQLPAASYPGNGAFLWRQIVGRSLYAAYIEPWYDLFDVLLVCLEDLATVPTAAKEMNRVAAFLALSDFDFTPVVAQGKFNAGDRSGSYEVATAFGDDETRPAADEATLERIAEFAQPFTERLFHMAKHRCHTWRQSPSSSSRSSTEL